MTRLNDCFVRRGKPIPEVGPRGTWQIKELRSRLLTGHPGGDGTPKDGWRFRLAPSIVTRSEAELFGISDPRFAARVYLDAPDLYPPEDANAYFINARRMLTFCANVPGWGQRQAYAKHCQIKHLHPQPCRPAWYLRESSCIADCVLPPTAAPTGYHVLTAPLGRVYGEIDTGPVEAPIREDVRGVPFLKHMRLGGGMCAQAVCFMATLLMHDDANGVHGVADITALAGGGMDEELPLAGLSPPEMFRYFRDERVGLNADWQFPASMGRERDESGWLQGALQAYIRSGMPVVFLVDCGRLAGLPNRRPALVNPAIYPWNEVGFKLRRPERVGKLHHAVLVIGCDEGDRFLLNDAATFPFLEASAGQLYEARLYRDDACTEPAVPIFLPVTPACVRMPLQEWYRDGVCANPDDRHPGLLQIAQLLQTGWFPPDRPLEVRVPCDPGGMKLVPLSRLGAVVPDGARPVAEAWLEALPDEEDLWCWVQCIEAVTATDQPITSVWLWDATRAPPDTLPRREEATDYCLAVFANGRNGWESLWVHPALAKARVKTSSPAAPAPPPSGTPAGDTLRPALISSFATEGGLPAALRDWPDKEVGCELYVFMRPDAERYLKKSWELRWRELKNYCSYGFMARFFDLLRLWPFGKASGTGKRWRGLRRWRRRPSARWPTSTALEMMASLAGDKDALGRVAQSLADEFKSSGIRIVAIATFLPEVVGTSHRTADAADAALRFLFNLAGRLREKHDHPVSVVEIVAGSVIHGVWPGRTQRQSEADGRESPTFVANRFAPERIFARLLASLQSMVEDIVEAGVHVAVELEPGPLYTLGSLKTLNRFCSVVKDYPKLSPYLSINVDVAHWALAGDIWSRIGGLDPSVWRRVIHAHVSDHGRGHLGDLRLGVVHPLGYFRDCLQFVKQASAADLAELATGREKHVAVELEACAEMTFVTKSVTDLQSIL